MSTVPEILQAAAMLDPHDRAALVASLLEDLDAAPHYVSDDEALRRRNEVRGGTVEGLTEEEFWRACGRRA